MKNIIELLEIFGKNSRLREYANECESNDKIVEIERMHQLMKKCKFYRTIFITIYSIIYYVTLVYHSENLLQKRSYKISNIESKNTY